MPKAVVAVPDHQQVVGTVRAVPAGIGTEQQRERLHQRDRVGEPHQPSAPAPARPVPSERRSAGARVDPPTGPPSARPSVWTHATVGLGQGADEPEEADERHQPPDRLLRPTPQRVQPGADERPAERQREHDERTGHPCRGRRSPQARAPQARTPVRPRRGRRSRRASRSCRRLNTTARRLSNYTPAPAPPSNLPLPPPKPTPSLPPAMERDLHGRSRTGTGTLPPGVRLANPVRGASALLSQAIRASVPCAAHRPHRRRPRRVPPRGSSPARGRRLPRRRRERYGLRRARGRGSAWHPTSCCLTSACPTSTGSRSAGRLTALLAAAPRSC